MREQKNKNNKIMYVVGAGLLIYVWFNYGGFNGLVKEPFVEGWNKNTVSENYESVTQNNNTQPIPQEIKSENVVKTESQAVDLVNNLDEIKRWKSLFTNGGFSPQTGGVPMIEVWEETDEVYKVDVYEKISDRSPNYGFYVVEKKTGQVYKQKKY
jgi:hypothetical protein